MLTECYLMNMERTCIICFQAHSCFFWWDKVELKNLLRYLTKTLVAYLTNNFSVLDEMYIIIIHCVLKCGTSQKHVGTNESMGESQNVTVVVSCGYDTCFSVQACDGLYQLIKSIGSDWKTIWVSIDRVDLGQSHCKLVPDCSRPSGSDQVTWAKLKQVNTRGFPPVPTFNMGCALAIVFQVCSLYIPTITGYPSWSLFPGVPSL